MTANSTQPSHPPLELSVMNIEQDFDIHSSLPVNITATSQSSFMSFNQTNMIPSAASTDRTVTNDAEQINQLTTEQPTLTRQETEEFERRHRERRQRLHEAHQHLQQERRRINQEQRRIDQERERLNRERAQGRRERHPQRQTLFELRLPQRTESAQNNSVRYRSPPRYGDRHFHEMMSPDPMEEPMDGMYNEQLIEVYNYETMNPQARQETWDQEHLQEMQGRSEPQHLATETNSLESYALARESQLQHDENEQDMRIYEMLKEEYSQQDQRNNEQLMDKEEWEDIAFRLAQQR